MDPSPPKLRPRQRVLLLHHLLIAESLRHLLEPLFDVSICTSASSTVSSIANQRPGTLLMDPSLLDSSLEETDAIAFVREILSQPPVLKIVFLSRHLHLFVLKQALQAGVHGFVLEQQRPEELCDALRTVIRGRTYIAPQLEMELLQCAGPSASETGVLQPLLTPRQEEVLRLIAEGRTSKRIAELLRISPKTVEFHKAAIMDSIGLRTVAELSRFAMQKGLVGPTN